MLTELSESIQATVATSQDDAGAVLKAFYDKYIEQQTAEIVVAVNYWYAHFDAAAEREQYAQIFTEFQEAKTELPDSVEEKREEVEAHMNDYPWLYTNSKNWLEASAGEKVSAFE